MQHGEKRYLHGEKRYLLYNHTIEDILFSVFCFLVELRGRGGGGGSTYPTLPYEVVIIFLWGGEGYRRGYLNFGGIGLHTFSKL